MTHLVTERAHGHLLSPAVCHGNVSSWCPQKSRGSQFDGDHGALETKNAEHYVMFDFNMCICSFILNKCLFGVSPS